MTRLFCFESAIKVKPPIKRALLVITFVIMLIAFIWFAGIATPTRYRVGFWQKLPLLDHRLLPHVSAIFAAAFGAFFGSLSAFHLGRVQQRSDRREKRHAGLIAAEYALMSQWNIVEQIRVGLLERARNNPDRFAKLPLYHFDVSPTFVPFADLTFILETNDPNALQDIHLAEQSYHTCVNAMRLRNEELAKFYQNPRVSHRILDFETGAAQTQADPQDTFFLRKATDGLYSCVDRTLPRLVGTIEKLEKLRRSLFPEKKPLRMITESPASNPSTTANESVAY